MTTLAEQYVRAFGADRFFGLDMVPQNGGMDLNG